MDGNVCCGENKEEGKGENKVTKHETKADTV